MEKIYTIMIDGKDYSQYLSLPFNINLRADEAYNNASLTLIRTDIKYEFEPYTDVIIEVSNSNTTYRYHMVVEEDSVEEVYRLTKPFYNHRLTLIERTKILDGIYVPDFTITNPATRTSVENFIGTERVIGIFAGRRASCRSCQKRTLGPQNLGFGYSVL